MNLKKVAAAVAVSAAACSGAAFAVPSITYADATAAPFTLFDYNGGGTAFTTGFAPSAGNNFTLTYFANTVALFNSSTALFTPNLDISQDGPSAGKTYEITVVATLNETVTGCFGTTCAFDLLAGSVFSVYYDSTPDANNALGTGFSDGELLLSGSLFPTTGSTGGVFAGSGDGSGTSSLLGMVNFTQTVCDATHPACISPALTGTVVGTQLNLGNRQTTPPAGGYQGTAFTGAAGQLVFQADGQQSFTAAVPEPGTVTLFGIGMTGLALALRRRRKAK